MVSLTSLIAETKKQQDEGLDAFKIYMNKSLDLKKATDEAENIQVEYIKKVIDNFSSGKYSDDNLDKKNSLEEIWMLLEDNKEYMDKLSTVVLPSMGTDEERLKAIELYLDGAISKEGSNS